MYDLACWLHAEGRLFAPIPAARAGENPEGSDVHEFDAPSVGDDEEQEVDELAVEDEAP